MGKVLQFKKKVPESVVIPEEIAKALREMFTEEEIKQIERDLSYDPEADNVQGPTGER